MQPTNDVSRGMFPETVNRSGVARSDPRNAKGVYQRFPWVCLGIVLAA